MIEIFNKLSRLNPYKGMNRENELVKHRTSKIKVNYYLLESWITGKDNDEWFTSNAGQLRIELNKYGLTPQEWYDMAVLGFTDINQRPRCSICEKEVEFSLCFGYRPYCSKSCQAKGTMTRDKCIKMHESWKNKLEIPEIRDEFSKKQSEGQTGMKRSPESIRKSIETKKANGNNRVSEEARRKIGIANKRNYSGNSEAIDRIMNVGYHRTKNGYYKPIKCSYTIRYLSSWELDFMKICDESDLVNKIDKGMKFRYFNSLVGEDKTYVSDFTITMNSGDIVIVEIKPKCFIYKQVVTDKRNAAISECSKLNYKFVMLTKDDLYNESDLNYNLDISKESDDQFKTGQWNYYK